MKYTQFVQRLNETTVVGQVIACTDCYGHFIQQSDRGVFIDRHASEFSSLEEAVDYIKQQRIREELYQEIQQDHYSEISSNKIVDIIKHHHNNVRVTDTLIESYVELASSKSFTLDSVVLDIRNLNKIDRLIENRIDFQLNDGTVMVITEESQRKLNNIFGQHSDVVDYIRSSKDAFLSVLNQLEE